MIKQALKAAFPYTIPIFMGYIFLGMAYGIYMNVSGFPFYYPMITSLFIYAGAMEFVTVNLLMGVFDPLNAFLLTLMVNARHLFYGVSLLDKYKHVGKKKGYLIYAMTDETFSINCTIDIPEGIDKGWFMFFISLLNHSYWFLGATLGGLFGEVINFNIKGLEFTMTALLIVLFLEQFLKEKSHTSSYIGVIVTVLCRLIFGVDRFVVASMLIILAILTYSYRKEVAV